MIVSLEVYMTFYYYYYLYIYVFCVNFFTGIVRYNLNLVKRRKDDEIWEVLDGGDDFGFI
jgi:hypothetical protein